MTYFPFVLFPGCHQFSLVECIYRFLLPSQVSSWITNILMYQCSKFCPHFSRLICRSGKNVEKNKPRLQTMLNCLVITGAQVAEMLLLRIMMRFDFNPDFGAVKWRHVCSTCFLSCHQLLCLPRLTPENKSLSHYVCLTSRKVIRHFHNRPPFTTENAELFVLGR